MAILWIFLVIQLEFLTVENYIVFNETYDETEIFSVGEDGTYKDETIQDDPDNYNLEDFQADYKFEKKSQLLDFEERYVKPDIKHNSKLYKNYRREKKKRSNDNSDDEHTYRYSTEAITTAQYDYEQFKREYDHDVDELKKFRANLNLSEFQTIPKPQCNGIFDVGPFSMICLIQQYNHGETDYVKEEAGKSIMNLLTIWGYFFAVLFLVGWGHFGYCNWVCPTKYCFPDDGYEEIKQKLALNPPGSMVKKIDPKKNDESKTKIEKEYYKPSETEYYLYNSLWKDIYQV